MPIYRDRYKQYCLAEGPILLALKFLSEFCRVVAIVDMQSMEKVKGEANLKEKRTSRLNAHKCVLGRACDMKISCGHLDMFARHLILPD